MYILCIYSISSRSRSQAGPDAIVAAPVQRPPLCLSVPHEAMGCMLIGTCQEVTCQEFEIMVNGANNSEKSCQLYDVVWFCDVLR